MGCSCSGEDSQVETLTCELNCESKCIDFLRSVVVIMTKRMGMNPCHSNRVALAVDELFANIAEHGYAGRPGRIEFETRIDAHGSKGKELVFNFRDYTHSDWTYQECETHASGCEPRAITPGGLGLKLIREVADCFEQQKLADGNRWHLTFCVHGSE